MNYQLRREMQVNHDVTLTTKFLALKRNHDFGFTNFTSADA